MRQLLTLTGSIAGLFGIVLCVISGLARLTGLYHLAGYEGTTIFMVGTGAMVFACLVKLELLSARLE